MQRALVVGVCGIVIGSAAVGPAAAGEITGGGKRLASVPNPDAGAPTPEGPAPDFVLHGKSLCAYSGLNDEYVEEGVGDHVQTPAGAKRFVGYACNPSGKQAPAG